MAARRRVFGVFAGGGVKAAAFAGALQEAASEVEFVGWGGTSAGSIVAGLMACGYTIKELNELIDNTDFTGLFEASLWRTICFPIYKGVVNNSPLLKWLRVAIGKKFDEDRLVYFGDLKDSQLLKVVATNISDQKIEVFSKQSSANVEIASAILCSCAFPLVFPPVKLHEQLLVDGGVLSNFPLWLFDDERLSSAEFADTSVLGFTILSRGVVGQKLSLAHYIRSLFRSILTAQDKVQEKYRDPARNANVIRIATDDVSTFDGRGNAVIGELRGAGRRAARAYFEKATPNYGKRVPIGVPMAIGNIDSLVGEGSHAHALSAVIQQHLVYGGVARDEGFSTDRTLVRYYIDLMSASVDHAKLDALATIIAHRIGSHRDFHRIIGMKNGNVLLAYAVAKLLGKPISLFRGDSSFKIGPPFDGEVNCDERVVIVDDVTSDATMLENVVRHLNLCQAKVDRIVCLVDRREGDAGVKFKTSNTTLQPVCTVSDQCLDNLISDNRLLVI